MLTCNENASPRSKRLDATQCQMHQASGNTPLNGSAAFGLPGRFIFHRIRRLLIGRQFNSTFLERPVVGVDVNHLRFGSGTFDQRQCAFKDLF